MLGTGQRKKAPAGSPRRRSPSLSFDRDSLRVMACFSQYLILRFRVDVPDSLASFSQTAKEKGRLKRRPK